MTELDVYDPTGATEVSELHAPRLAQLAGRTVAFLSNDMWQAHRMLPALRDYLTAEIPGITTIPETDLPMGNVAIDREQTVDDLVARGVDAVVIGNAS